MMQTPVSAVTVERKTTVYSSFKGVDFSVDASLVDKSRSPYAPNLISDIGGLPEKRLGWREVLRLRKPINGMWRGEVTVDGELKEVFIVHGKGTLYSITEEDGVYSSTELKINLNNARSAGFFMNDGEGMKLYILTGKEYIVYDGKTVKNVSENAYVPIILIGRRPTGGGTTFESVNLLGNKREEQFLGNETDKVFYLSADEIASVDKVMVMDAKGDMEEYTATTGTPSAKQYKVDLTEGTVTFNEPLKPTLTGVDNVYITYSKKVDGYAERITKCTGCALYGYGGDNRVFLTGNPEYKAYDWYSGIYDPAYFPDLGYTIIGSDDTAVMGYLKLGQYLLIVKEDSSVNSTLLQRSAIKNAEGDTEFYVEQGVTGLGAISKNCFVNLIDEPMFLSRQGVMGIYSTNILAERSFKNRSYFVNSKLIKEENLKDACACEWNGYYILAVDGRAYIMDSKNKSYLKYQSATSSDYIYECYYWENIPARIFCEKGGELYFGTEEGMLCKLNTDIDTMAKYNDTYRDDDNGEPVDHAIACAWATKNDDDGASYLYKTMQKRGCSVTIKPFTRSSATVYLVKDGDYEDYSKTERVYMDIFTFDDLSFERLSFNTNDSPQDVYIKKKVKKYKRLQIVIKNEAVGEGFGIFQIAKTYAVGNYAKK